MAEHVYIFKSQDLYKIGRTGNIPKRLSNYSDSPFVVEFVFGVSVPDSRAIERQLHLEYKSYHVRGEWFGLDDSQVEAIKEKLSVIGESYNPVRLSSRLGKRSVTQSRDSSTGRVTRRNKALDLKAQELGFDSLSQFLTAWKNKKVNISIVRVKVTQEQP